MFQRDEVVIDAVLHGAPGEPLQERGGARAFDLRIECHNCLAVRSRASSRRSAGAEALATVSVEPNRDRRGVRSCRADGHG